MSSVCFLGMLEQDVNDVYEFVSGGDNGYRSWAGGQPNDQTANNCIVLRENKNYNWDDGDCAEVKRLFKFPLYHRTFFM